MGGFVQGARSRTQRPVLIAGNLIAAEFRARTDAQLASLSAELTQSRAGLMGEPLAAAGIEWACALAAVALPEAHPYPRLYAGLDGVLTAIEAAPSARGWAAALVRYEALVLAELGYGHDLADLPGDWAAILAALTANGARLERYVLVGKRAEVLPARERLVERLKRAVA
jgi:DNA repair protein RecO (recombination protein O)